MVTVFDVHILISSCFVFRYGDSGFGLKESSYTSSPWSNSKSKGWSDGDAKNDSNDLESMLLSSSNKKTTTSTRDETSRSKKSYNVSNTLPHFKITHPLIRDVTCFRNLLHLVKLKRSSVQQRRSRQICSSTRTKQT